MFTAEPQQEQWCASVGLFFPLLLFFVTTKNVTSPNCKIPAGAVFYQHRRHSSSTLPTEDYREPLECQLWVPKLARGSYRGQTRGDKGISPRSDTCIPDTRGGWGQRRVPVLGAGRGIQVAVPDPCSPDPVLTRGLCPRDPFERTRRAAVSLLQSPI